MRRLVLFDIDGTLLTAAGAGRRAYERAMEAVYGPVGSLANHPFGGKTDPQIAHEVLRPLGFAPERINAGLDEMLDLYLGHLGDAMPTHPGVRLMPGVEPLLARLRAEPGVTLGLLTGNVAGGAKLKLDHFGLFHHFRFGAFGSDSGIRKELPAIAVARAEALVGHRHAGKEIVIIGDTEHDIACGRELGVKAIAVATGPYAAAHLAAHGPDHLFDDLSPTDDVVAAILS
jgi:phosphoglycolate phosphatase-like HAD superfamily hydrolase